MRSCYFAVLLLALTTSPALAGGLLRIDVPGASATVVEDLNEAGGVVGIFATPGDGTHGFFWSKGNVVIIDVPTGQQTHPLGVNNAGDVVGIYRDGTVTRGFLFRDGIYITLHSPSGRDLWPFDINNRGDIVGYFREVFSLTNRGFLLDADGTFTDIFVRSETLIQGISDAGDMVGIWGDIGGRGFFVGKHGDEALFDVPDAVWTFPRSINNAGVVVGDVQLSLVSPRVPFVLRRKNLEIVTIPGVQLTSIAAVNNRGDMAGTYSDGEGIHGFILAK